MLTDVMKAVEQLSLEELRQLREYVQQREQQIELHPATVDMDALLRGLEEIRAGLSDETFGEIERAMNEKILLPNLTLNPSPMPKGDW